MLGYTQNQQSYEEFKQEDIESAFNYDSPDAMNIQQENWKKWQQNYQSLSNLEHGFGGQYNSKLYKIKSGSQGNNSKNTVTRSRNQHFIYRDKKNQTYYLYHGANFEDRAGYELLLMGKYFPEHNEIRMYSSNDIRTDIGKSALISSKNKIQQANPNRVMKEQSLPFDYENGHFAKICLNRQ